MDKLSGDFSSTVLNKFNDIFDPTKLILFESIVSFINLDSVKYSAIRNRVTA